MARVPEVPGSVPQTVRHVRRTENLEREQRIGNDPRSRFTAPLEAPYSQAGALVVASSPRWYPRRDATLTEVLASLDTAGSTSTVVTVYVNGGSVGTVTLGSGVNMAVNWFNSALVGNVDYLTMGVTSVGTGASDLAVQARFT